MHFNRFVAIAGLIALSNLFGQDKPEPDYSNVAYVYDSASNKLVSLERENAQPAAKMKAFGGIKGTSQISGLKSPVRFPSDEKLVFVFKAPPDLDPQSLVEIVKLTPQKDHREIIRLQSHGFMGMGGVKSEADKADVPLPPVSTAPPPLKSRLLLHLLQVSTPFTNPRIPPCFALESIHRPQLSERIRLT